MVFVDSGSGVHGIYRVARARWVIEVFSPVTDSLGQRYVPARLFDQLDCVGSGHCVVTSALDMHPKQRQPGYGWLRFRAYGSASLNVLQVRKRVLGMPQRSHGELSKLKVFMSLSKGGHIETHFPLLKPSSGWGLWVFHGRFVYRIYYFLRASGPPDVSGGTF